MEGGVEVDYWRIPLCRQSTSSTTLFENNYLTINQGLDQFHCLPLAISEMNRIIKKTGGLFKKGENVRLGICEGSDITDISENDIQDQNPELWSRLSTLLARGTTALKEQYPEVSMLTYTPEMVGAYLHGVSLLRVMTPKHISTLTPDSNGYVEIESLSKYDLITMGVPTSIAFIPIYKKMFMLIYFEQAIFSSVIEFITGDSLLGILQRTHNSVEWSFIKYESTGKAQAQPDYDFLLFDRYGLPRLGRKPTARSVLDHWIKAKADWLSPPENGCSYIN